MIISGYGFATLLVVIVVAIAIVDFRRQIIPDWLTIALAASGLAWQTWTAGGFPLAAIVFAILVLAGFWTVRFTFSQLRQSTGLGLGDVKMAGAGALWFDPWNLPLFLIVACCSALAFVLVMALRDGGFEAGRRVPFGPFLGLGIVATHFMERGGFTTFIPHGAN